MPQHPQNTLRIPVFSDESILQLFDELARSFPGSAFRVTIPGQDLGQWNNRIAFDGGYPNRDWTSSRIISTGAVTVADGSLTINFQRTTTGAGQSASMWENEIWFDRHKDLQAQKFLEIVNAVDQFVTAKGGRTLQSVGPSTETQSLIASQIAKLAEVQANIVHDAERARLAAEARLTERAAALEQADQERRKQFEAEMDSAKAKVAEGLAELEGRKKQLDDRDHIHVRRGLRADITSAMQQRLSGPPVSKQTSRLRNTITLYSVVGIVGLLGLAAYGAWDTHSIATKPGADIWSLGYATIRFLAPLAVATGLLIYLLNWMRRVHSEDVRSERDLERYRFDIDRASWAFETIQEAQTKDGSKVPETWIAGATQGMFMRAEPSDEEGSARDALASLLGFSAKAHVGTDGANLEFARNDLKRMSK